MEIKNGKKPIGSSVGPRPLTVRNELGLNPNQQPLFTGQGVSKTDPAQNPKKLDTIG